MTFQASEDHDLLISLSFCGDVNIQQSRKVRVQSHFGHHGGPISGLERAIVRPRDQWYITERYWTRLGDIYNVFKEIFTRCLHCLDLLQFAMAKFYVTVHPYSAWLWSLKSTAARKLVQDFVQVHNWGNFKTPHHWPIITGPSEESTVDGEFFSQRTVMRKALLCHDVIRFQ